MPSFEPPSTKATNQQCVIPLFQRLDAGGHQFAEGDGKRSLAQGRGADPVDQSRDRGEDGVRILGELVGQVMQAHFFPGSPDLGLLESDLFQSPGHALGAEEIEVLDLEVKPALAHQAS